MASLSIFASFFGFLTFVHFYMKVVILCQSVELSSAILQNTFQYFRRTPLSISTVHFSVIFTMKNTVIPPSFLVWKFCGEAQFPDSFGRNSQFNKSDSPKTMRKLCLFTNLSHQEIRWNYGIFRNACSTLLSIFAEDF